MSRKDLLPDAGPVLSLRAALYRACRDFRGGITAVALEMGVSPDALTKALSPSLNRPIMPEWIEDILTITQDERLAAALVRPGGAVAFKPMPVKVTPQALLGLAAMAGADASFVASLHEGVADGRWDLHEVLKLEHCASRVIAELLGICAGARQAMEDAEGADHG